MQRLEQRRVEGIAEFGAHNTDSSGRASRQRTTSLTRYVSQSPGSLPYFGPRLLRHPTLVAQRARNGRLRDASEARNLVAGHRRSGGTRRHGSHGGQRTPLTGIRMQLRVLAIVIDSEE